MVDAPKRIWANSGVFTAALRAEANTEGLTEYVRADIAKRENAELRAEYEAFQRDVKAREETFARKIGEQQARAEDLSRQLAERDAELARKDAALEPFSWIGQWLFARDLPDDTPMVTIEGAGKPFNLTRGMFKAAHSARAALSGSGDGWRELPLPDPTSHASTSPGPVNCSIRKRHQGELYPRTCERCCLGPCPFFHANGDAKRAAPASPSAGGTE